MQPLRPNQRAPGSFSPLPGSVSSSSAFTAAAAAAASSSAATASSNSNSNNPSVSTSRVSSPTAPPASTSRPQLRRIDTSSTDDASSPHPPRTRPSPSVTSPPPYANSPNASTSSLHSYSRPARPSNDASSVRTSSPLTLPPSRASGHSHSRKYSATQGHFEPSLPSASSFNLSQVGMASQPPHSGNGNQAMSASHAAAQAAFSQQSQQQQQAAPQQQQQQQQQQLYQLQQQQYAQQVHQQHTRHRSQTVPFPGSDNQEGPSSKRPAPKPIPAHIRSPPMLSLTEASVPRDNILASQNTQNAFAGPSSVATTAANVAFPRTSPQTSPGLPFQHEHSQQAPFPPPSLTEKKAEKSKVKLFSRPKKIDTKGDTKERPQPSPGKIGSALASLQRGNYSTTSLADQSSFYNMANSSQATIRPTESNTEVKEKEKKHHFLTRQKNKLKDDFHLPLSSAASNSRPVDPNAPPLYNFNVPLSPGLNNNLSKSVSGLDLRHGGRALREKRKEDRLEMRHDNESSYNLGFEGPSGHGATTPSYLQEPLDSSKYGLNSMSLDDAWPLLKAKLLVIFEGEDLRIPVEDLNRVVTMHIQYCIQRRAAYIILEDIRDFLLTGFASLDHTLRKTPDDRVIPALVELWMFTFTSILPYMQAVFLPLDLEFSGSGPLLSPEQARDFWSGLSASSPAPGSYMDELGSYTSPILDVRRIVLVAYRDALIIPRYEKLKSIFSRLSLEHLPFSLTGGGAIGQESSLASLSTSPPSDQTPLRPGTAMSIDPSNASYNSSSTTLFGDGSNPSRSRAISNVSYASAGSEPHSAGGMGGAYLRPFTPQAGTNREALTSGNLREQNVEDSKQVTEMVGRMLQCTSVLASVATSDPAATTAGSSGIGTTTTAGPSSGQQLPSSSQSAIGGGGAGGEDEPSRMVAELGRLLKLNWLGRGRTGRNRRGMVGGRVKREETNSQAGGMSHRRSGSGGAILQQGMMRDGVGVVG